MYDQLYTDDEGFLADLIKREWGIDFDCPNIYYIPNALARNNIPGSIYIYDLGRSVPKLSINYEFVRRVRRIAIDISNPENRDRHFAYVNEVIRILMKHRRAGPSRLNGYDYLEISNISDKPGYTQWYQTIIEVVMTKEFAPIPYAGFDVPCPKRLHSPQSEPSPPPCIEDPNDNLPAYDPDGEGEGFNPRCAYPIPRTGLSPSDPYTFSATAPFDLPI